MANVDEKTMREVKDFVFCTWELIKRTTNPAVIFSWGVRAIGGGLVKNTDGGDSLPALFLDVSGLIHTGRVVVMRVAGEYRVACFDAEGKRVGDWVDEIKYNEIGEVIDSLVEHPKDMSDEDYQFLSSLDSFLKMMAEMN